MRRGELLGLRREDVDLETRSIHVRRSLAQIRDRVLLKSPKTRRPRAISIDPDTARLLAERRREQEAHRSAAGEVWQDRWGLVFTTCDGEPLNPLRVTIAFRKLVADLPLPRQRLHDLRHCHASLMLEAGIPVSVVSERLGHADVSMTSTSMPTSFRRWTRTPLCASPSTSISAERSKLPTRRRKMTTRKIGDDPPPATTPTEGTEVGTT